MNVARITLVALLAAGSAQAQMSSLDHGTLAVLDFKNSVPAGSLSQSDATYFTDLVRGAALRANRNLNVMTRENLLVLLQASGKDLASCEGECEVATGRRIGADAIVSGELLKVGSSFKLNMRLHETHTGRLLSGEVAAGKTVDELDGAVAHAVELLLAPLATTAAAPQTASAAGNSNADESDTFHRHIGSYFHGALGASFLTLHTSYTTSSLQLDGSLFAGNVDMKLGYAFWENTILSLHAYDFLTSTSNCQDVFAIGPNFTHYFMPSDFYVSVTLNVTAYPAIGFGAQAALGKEWWVSSHWGVGVAAQLSYNLITDFGTGNVSAIAAGLALSVSYN